MARIRESIGDLMTDEDLKKILEKGVEKALFTSSVRGDSWRQETVPCLVDRVVSKHLNSRMAEAVDTWITDNPDKLQRAVENAIKAGVAKCLMDTLDGKFYCLFEGLVANMKSQGLIKT